MLLAEAVFNLSQSAGGLKTTDGPAFLARHNEEKMIEANIQSRSVGLIEERNGSSGKRGGCRENWSYSHPSASLCADLQCHKYCPFGGIAAIIYAIATQPELFCLLVKHWRSARRLQVREAARF